MTRRTSGSRVRDLHQEGERLLDVYLAQAIELRHDLHRHPEVGGEERNAAFRRVPVLMRALAAGDVAIFERRQPRWPEGLIQRSMVNDATPRPTSRRAAATQGPGPHRGEWVRR
jgi:hypothetical protein